MERRETRAVAQFKLAPPVCKDGPFRGYSRLDWIHTAAQRKKTEKCASLMHHYNGFNLGQALRSLSGLKASGVDGVTKAMYQQEVGKNLARLEQLIQRGGWRPKPSREVLIPKPQGGTRPLAVGCLEDKIVQTLTGKILEALYEPLYHRHSYGFRRGKSAHQAIGRLYETLNRRRESCFVVEVDIEKFFNSVSHDWLLAQLALKIGDAHFLRLVRRMLRNSIIKTDGKLAENLVGTPQGSPVSPGLANICLHYLLDVWFAENHGATGEFVRYADDVVFVFSRERDALNFFEAVKHRLHEAGLNVNEDKSKIVNFSQRQPQGHVEFLGFRFYWGRTRMGTKACLKAKTAPQRLMKMVQAFKEWIKAMRNRVSLSKLWDLAKAKFLGHYNYFGVMFNQAKLSHYYFACIGNLFRWVNRRSQRKSYTWQQFSQRLHFDPLPRPPLGRELVDITSEVRSAVKHEPKSRMRKLRTSGSVRSFGRQRPLFT